jgi:hypothetical protein
MSCPAFEPNAAHCEYSQPFRHIQYNRESSGHGNLGDVRICTSRCRCHSSCRRSRFSGLGTQMRGKLFSSSSFHRSPALLRSVYCFRTRLVLISAASPIQTSIPSSASNCSNQREYPGGLHPHAHADSWLSQFPIELLGFSLIVVRSRSPLSPVSVSANAMY